jgi:hypothetical protein
VTITGSGFATGAVVNVKRTAAPPLDVNRQPARVTPTQIEVALTASDLAVAGKLSLSVVNPTPGGASLPHDFSIP